MGVITLAIQILAAVAGILAALASILLFMRLRWPAPVLWMLKLYTSALSPMLTMTGVLIIITGLARGSVLTALIGLSVALVYFAHYLLVTRPPDAETNFDKAFGPGWEKQIAPETQKHFLKNRRILRLPAVPTPKFEPNIPFSTIPGTQRQLLCDLWMPPETIEPSGAAFIYLHGSAWYLLDKDFGTRPFFEHLAAQGHVVMDVAYRLFPETDMMGMIQDVKRAIAWMSDNAAKFRVHPRRIVVGGGSAGGHLALMAAFSADMPEFMPTDLEGKNLSVAGVVSLYGPTDLEVMYFHTNQHLTTRSTPGRPKKPVPTKMPDWMMKGPDFHRLGFDNGFENAGAFASFFGCHPDECPEKYAFFSPVNHVHSGCPPTLLLHGEHDLMAPVKTTRTLFDRLLAKKVPAVLHVLPQTDHAFDLILPKISPSSHNAFFDVERFLAAINATTREG